MATKSFKYNMRSLMDNAGAMRKKQDEGRPLWLANFADKLIESKTGVAFASPSVPFRPYDDKALEEYSRNLTALHRSLLGVDRVYFIHPSEQQPLAKMLHSAPGVCVFIISGKISVPALLKRKGMGRDGIYYPLNVVKGFEAFVDKFSSFLVVGSFPSVQLAYDALYAYLVNTGMHLKKRVDVDDRFTYSR